MGIIWRIFTLITLCCPLIKGVSPGHDIDASIAKLINGFGSHHSTEAFSMKPILAPVTKAPRVTQTTAGPTQPATTRGGRIFRPDSGIGVIDQQDPPRLLAPPTQPKGHLSAPTLNLVNGTASGKKLIFNNLDSLPAISTNECHLFLGIPYAAAPIDHMRFKAPKPATGWQGVLDATKYKGSCMQDPNALPRGSSISEDCLHVNIFKPAVSTPVPIVIWIHGGAFLLGSATSFNPTTMCRQVVVNTLTVVTVNYRVGPFGFAAHENLPSLDTNIGLRDIAQAVKWVQENAQALGGTADQIVLIGHGAGAALVSHLLDSSLMNTTSLKGAILMSGSGMAPWALTKFSWKSTAKLMKELKCPSLDCMKKIDATKIVEKSPRLWSPYIDDATITSRQSKVNLKRSDQQRFPVIMGFTLQEGTALAVQKLAPVTGRPLKDKVARSIVELTGDAQDLVERRYLHDRPVPLELFETIFDFIDTLSEAYSDTLFKLPTIKEATVRTQQQSANVYVYAVRNDVPLPGNYLPGYKASYHGSDLDLFWSPYARQSRVNLLGAFLQVVLHQEEKLPWRPWSPQSPVVLQITPYGGQFITFRPPDSLTANHTYTNATARYGTTTVSWTKTTERKFTIINATPFPISFNRKKIIVPTSTTTTATTPREDTTTTATTIGAKMPAATTSSSTETFDDDDGDDETSQAETTMETESATTASTTKTKPPPTSTATTTSNVFATEMTENLTKDTEGVLPTEPSSSPPNGTPSTSSKVNYRVNGSTETNTVAGGGQQDSLVWVLLGLAILFLFLFLVTVGGCAAWNRQSYHPHPNRRSRHQGAKVRNGQQRVPPPVAPLDSSNGSSPQTQPAHQQRSHKDADNGKQAGRRLASHQTSGPTSIITNAHRRPRQPPPGLPPLLGKDSKRN